jgi:cytochrome c5
MLLLVAIRAVEIAAEAGDDRQGEAAAVAPRGGIAAREDREFVRVVLHDHATLGLLQDRLPRRGQRAACSDEGVQRVEFHPVETKERAGIKPPSTRPQQ